MNAQTTVAAIIPHLNPQRTVGQGEAPVNIALCKYWGKRDVALNLPCNSSLSLSLAELGSSTSIRLLEGQDDEIWLDDVRLDPENSFSRRLTKYLDLFRPADCGFQVKTHNSVPTAAGLASSASGFAALVIALDDLFGWQLSTQQLSILARLGSGSACRSFFPDFARWQKGERADGLDSYATALPTSWPDLCLGLIKVDFGGKKIGSTVAMQQTTATSPLHAAWSRAAEQQLDEMCDAISDHNFTQMGEIAENNALGMHATMLAARPPILYWQAETVRALETVWKLRREGLEVYATMDAGPNVKLLYLQENKSYLSKALNKAGFKFSQLR